MSNDNYYPRHSVDYSKLQQLLSEGKWREADYQTYLVMLAVFGRKEGDWIRPEEIKNFPTSDLLAIDKLWRKYSSDKFGFSIQKKIYIDNKQSVEKLSIQDSGIISNESVEFVKRVGWQMDSYKDLIFDITQAPKGHLPGCWAFRFFGFGWYLMSHKGI
ncbi:MULTISPECIES: GUN4 domain-containing protein [unclassified Moorena]|uniref:GUN4 domain-containing protein n=1 Tax=unclassified Moorena TaxID=2683338 RepID=UPI0013B69707|nr:MULTISPECIES: GUN4 domain-containing protein [unclassified Moorena]NER92132.1 GUN4 domain-containing protein [Moorena sp. SIO3A2]NES42355.1 GUN4 domain-containing protein [Moorena sp. SIO2C4]NET64146.1 GUN4 domain-containing protein [Moorena sp. SIO1G6]